MWYIILCFVYYFKINIYMILDFLKFRVGLQLLQPSLGNILVLKEGPDGCYIRRATLFG